MEILVDEDDLNSIGDQSSNRLTPIEERLHVSHCLVDLAGGNQFPQTTFRIPRSLEFDDQAANPRIWSAANQPFLLSDYDAVEFRAVHNSPQCTHDFTPDFGLVF